MSENTILYVKKKADMMKAFVTGAIMTMIPNAPMTPVIGKIQMVEWEDGSGNSFNMNVLMENGDSVTVYKRFPPDPPNRVKRRKNRFVDA